MRPFPEWPLPRRAAAVGATAAAAALAVYTATLCPSVYAEGAGELIGATVLLGTAHPTGYPLFCLLGRVFCAVAPLGDAALEVNAFAALTGAAAAGALAAWLVGRGLSPWASLAGGLLWAFSRTFWSQSVIAEVYGLAALSAVLVAAAGTGPLAHPRRLALLGLVLGIGVQAHLQVALLGPAAVWLALAGGARAPGISRWRRAARRLPWLGGGALLGYSPILYLVLRNGRGSGFHWSRIGDAAELWEHVSGALYRPSFFSMPLDGVLLNARRWTHLAAADLHPLLLPVILWGGWQWARRDGRSFGLWASAAALNLATGLHYHRDPAGLAVFFFVSLLALAIAAACGLDDLGARLSGRPGRAGAWGRALAAGVPVALVLAGNWAVADRSEYDIARAYGAAVLDGLPPDAILVTEGDHVSFIVDYLWRVEGRRRDVLVAQRLGRGSTAAAWRQPGLSRAERLAAQARWERDLLGRGGRPLFYTVARQPPARDCAFAAAGLVYRAVPAAGVAAAARTFPDSLLDRTRAASPDIWSRRILAEYWFMRGEYLLQTGRRSGALDAFEAAARTAPRARTVRYNVAVILLRNNQLEDALRHARGAGRIDPMQPEPHRLAAVILGRLGRRAEAAQSLERARALGRDP